MTRFPLVYVEWIDAVSAARWCPVDELTADPSPCRTVGWIVKENDQALCLAQTMSGETSETDESVLGRLVIPKAWIGRRVELFNPAAEPATIRGEPSGGKPGRSEVSRPAPARRLAR